MTNIYVGNLAHTATEDDLRTAFSEFGAVSNVSIVKDRETGRPRGFAFVTMNTIDEAKRAGTELHDKEFMGRKLVVSGAKTSDIRS